MKNLFKGTCLVVALMATFAMVGCGGGGGGSSKKTSDTISMNVLVDGTPLAAPVAAPASSLRAAQVVDKITLKIAGYDKGVEKASFKLTDREATFLEKKDGKSGYACIVDGLLPGVDYRFSAWNGSDKFMENQLAADELQNGGGVEVSVETTLKTKVYDAWIAKAVAAGKTNKSVSNFKKNLTDSGKQTTDAAIAALSGVDKDQYTKELNNVANKKEGAKLPEVKEIDLKDVTVEDKEPQPTPTTGYVDKLNKELAENTTWKPSDERAIYKHLTTGREFPGQIYDEEIDDWVDVEAIADGGMAAEIIYSTKDGANWTALTDKPIIIYDEMGGSHPYCLYKNNQRVGPNQQFHYKKAKNLFRYIQYSWNPVEEPVEKGLECREVLFSGYYKVEEITSEGVTYYRATNNDNAKDIYLFKLIKRPEEIFKVNPSDEVIQLEKLINDVNWKPATEKEIQELIGYKDADARSARVIYSHNGTKWETPTNVFLTYAKIPYAHHPWHVYVNGKHAEGASIETNNDVWYISNLVVSENKTIAGSYKFLTTTIEGADYLQMKKTDSDNIMTSMFMKVVSLPGDIEDDIKKMINNSSASGNVRR